MQLLGPLHLTLLAAIAAIAIVLSKLAARRRIPLTSLRLALGIFLALNEFVWWIFRYSHEGIHVWNLPLQLCDLTLWLSVFACLTLRPVIVEFAYFGGLAGAGMALLTPDLWSPWPTYPAIYFFIAHGGIMVAACVLVFGRISPLRPGAVWRTFGALQAYAVALALLDAFTDSNYMYLSAKPRGVSALSAMGPWPVYILFGESLALALFWLLWLPAPKQSPAGGVPEP